MKEYKSVKNINSYGKITVHLKELLEQHGLTRYRLSKLADTRFEVVEKWCSGHVERIDSDILARFCYILSCKPEDILHYRQDDPQN